MPFDRALRYPEKFGRFPIRKSVSLTQYEYCALHARERSEEPLEFLSVRRILRAINRIILRKPGIPAQLDVEETDTFALPRLLLGEIPHHIVGDLQNVGAWILDPIFRRKAK